MDSSFRFSDEQPRGTAHQYVDTLFLASSQTELNGKTVKLVPSNKENLSTHDEDHFLQANAVRHYYYGDSDEHMPSALSES
jgi:hypothetical protein